MEPNFSFPVKFYDRLWYLSRQIAILMFALTLLRLFFLAWNWPTFSFESSFDLLISFVVGWRFDAASIAILLSPLIFLHLLPLSDGLLSKAALRRFQRIWLAFAVLLLLIPNLSDTEHFHFIRRRATLDLFVNPKDFQALILPVLSQYWVFVLGAFAFIALVLRSCLKIREKRLPIRIGALAWALHFVGLLFVTVLVARGGLQRRPMNATHAFLANPSANLAALSLNSTYTLLRSIKARQLEPLHFFPDNQKIANSLRAMQSFSDRGPQFSNVIILIMESMGTEFLGVPNQQESRIPFVESFEHTGILFENNFANGGETSFAFNSVLASLPQMMAGSIIGSAYENNRIVGLGSILKRYGYKTFFFHGGPQGLFYFDIRAKRLGFDQHFTMADYGDKDFDGEWGIFDEPFLQFMADKLENESEPFISAFLSVSNHPPYKLPPGYAAPDRPTWTRKEQTAFYADKALEKFFARIRKASWFDKTLFVITGDHAPFEKNPRYVANRLGGWRVPLIFYHPRGLLPQTGRSLRLTQQVDIVPSVLDLLGLGERERDKVTPFGRSVFQNGPGLALIYDFGTYGLVSGLDYTELPASGESKRNSLDPNFFNLDPSLPGLEAKEQERLLKTYVQFFHFAMIENQLYRI